MTFQRNLGLACLAGLGVAAAALPAGAKITFDIDYSLDSNNFFNPNTTNGKAARTAIAQAAAVYEDRIVDTLTSITPSGSGGNTWDAKITNPGTGTSGWTISNLIIPTGSIKVYVGGRSLGGALGLGGPGGYSANSTTGDSNFISSVVNRGQAGAQPVPPATDFGPWGGSIAFDNSVSWNFNLTPPTGQRNDFLTVATHELAHVLGFGTAPSWQTLLTPSGSFYVGPFTGPKATKLNNNNPVPLETPPAGFNAAHFDYGIMSTAGGKVQETLMDPDITVGTRKAITLLDWAALDDIGWDLAKGGDADANGVVDFNDLVKVAQSYNVVDGQRRWSQGDFNYDGNVDFNDLVILAQNYNSSGVQAGDAIPAGAPADFAGAWAAAQEAVVPEPAGLVAAGAFAVGMIVRRRRPGH